VDQKPISHDAEDYDDSSPPKPGEVLMVTASSGTNGFLGIPNLKEMVYENRMSYAHRWGESTPKPAMPTSMLTHLRLRLHVGKHLEL
jgi:hypothetical protein